MYYVFTSLFTVNLFVITVEAMYDRLEMLHIITLKDTKLEGVKRRKIDNKMVKRDGTK
jgi:hypothetical protein